MLLPGDGGRGWLTPEPAPEEEVSLGILLAGLAGDVPRPPELPSGDEDLFGVLCPEPVLVEETGLGILLAGLSGDSKRGAGILLAGG